LTRKNHFTIDGSRWGIIVKKPSYILFIALQLAFVCKGYAHSEFENSPVYEECYSFRTTDSLQKKQAVGMVASGILFFVAIGLFSGLMPQCIGGDETPITDTSTTNTIISN
jgi:hypothetical protein